MNSLGPTIQAIRQPGRRKRLVRPSIRRTSVRISPPSLLIVLIYERKGRGWRTILIDIDNVGGTADCRAITVSGVIVTTVEFIQNERCAISADVLDLGKLVIRDEVSSRVTGVRRQEDRSSTSNLLRDLVGMDMVVVFFGERNGNRCDLCRSIHVSNWPFSTDSSKAEEALKGPKAA